VIVDSREQDTPRAKSRYKALGAPVERATLNYGDYCGNVTLPSQKALYELTERISPSCVIERKMDLDELASCFTRGRERFEREFERATSVNAKVYLLIENANMEAIINHRYRSKFNSDAFLASVIAWSARYNITPIMCRAETSGRIIREILFRDMKERLERGEYG
jgi:ERCC4-type nuclease